jgi:hypothetical protein
MYGLLMVSERHAMDTSTTVLSLTIGTGTRSHLQIQFGDIETYYPSVEISISIEDQWIHIQQWAVWIDRKDLMVFVSQLQAWSQSRETGARLASMSPDAFTLELQLHGRAKNVRVQYGLQTIAPDTWGPLIHGVSGSFDLNMEYVLQLIHDTQRIFTVLEQAWGSLE